MGGTKKTKNSSTNRAKVVPNQLQKGFKTAGHFRQDKKEPAAKRRRGIESRSAQKRDQSREQEKKN